MLRKSITLSILISMLISTNLYAKQVIGVTAFKNLTKDTTLKWLEIGIADSISYKLRNVKEYIVVDRTNVDKTIGEVALGQTGIIDEKTAKKAGKALGADIIVVGNFQKYGKQVRINAKLIEVESHKVLKQVQSTGVMDNIFNLQDQIALKIINQTNISISKEVKMKIIENFTLNLSAYEFYVKGQEFLLYKLNYVKAIEMFNKAIAIDNKYSLAYAGLGKAYSLRNWELRNYSNLKDSSVLDKSYQYSTKALELNPNLDEAHVALARYYQEVDKKRFPKKWELCEKEARLAIKINPQNGEAYFILSRIFGYDDKKEEKYLLLALKYNKFLTDGHNNLGVIYLDRGVYDKAEESFKKAIEIDPGFKTGYMNLGVVYDRKGQKQKALEMYKKVLLKYPNYPLGLRNLGIGYRELKQYDKAMEQFRKIVKIKKDDAKGWSEIAYIYLLKKQYKQAISTYKISLKYDPDYKYSLANIGYSYAEIGEYRNAIVYLKQAANKHKNYAWPCGHMGWIYRDKLNDKKNAKYWYGQAMRRDPNNSNYRNSYNNL